MQFPNGSGKRLNMMYSDSQDRLVKSGVHSISSTDFAFRINRRLLSSIFVVIRPAQRTSRRLNASPSIACSRERYRGDETLRLRQGWGYADSANELCGYCQDMQQR